MRTSIVQTLGVGQLNIISDVPGEAGNTTYEGYKKTVYRRSQATSMVVHKYTLLSYRPDQIRLQLYRLTRPC